MAITIATAAASLNLHHRTYDTMIQQKLRVGMETERMLAPTPTDRTFVAPNVEVSDLVQAYQKAFTPSGNLDFNAVENTLQKLKVDIVYEPDDLDQFWDKWLLKVDELGKSRLQYTFPEYMYNEVMMPKIIENMELKIAYKGVFVAPTAGTPGLTINAADGLGKKIADAITAGSLTPIATGALVASTMVNQIEAFCDALPIPYRDLPGVLLMSHDNAKKYTRDYRNQFGTGNSNMGNENTELRVDATQKRIVGVASMTGSNRIIYSTPGNLIYGLKRGGSYLPQIRWQEYERTLKGLAEFHRFYGVKFWANTFVNDQV
jgi:hypothetical protein